ncbi:MAG: DMT family transporter [Betaproteobacteria bacterium]|nr:DMT family transporter [Betaproteobacteria bacterium]
MFPIAKRSLAMIDAFALGTLRYVLGLAIFSALLWAIEGRQAFRYGTRLWPAIGFGVFGITGFNTLVWYGLNFTRPEHAGILMALQTPLIALSLWVLRGQRPAAFTLGCVAVAIGGVILVVTKGDPARAFEGGSLLGDVLVLLGAVCWVAYSMAGGRFTGWSSLRMTTLTCIPGGIGLLLANATAVATGFVPMPSLEAIGQVWWQILYFAAGSVVLGVLGFNAGVKHLGALNAMLMVNLVPVGVFAIEAALGRRYETVELAGAALVIGALVANNLYLRKLR